MKTIEIPGIDFETAHETPQWAEAGGHGQAIMIGGKHLCAEAEIDRLETDGVEFAKLVDHELPDGAFRILTIPVNE